MANNFFKVKRGQNLEPKTGSTVTTQGDIAVNASSNQIEYHNGTTVESITTTTNTQTLTNKTLTNPVISGSTASITVQDTNLTIQDNLDNTKQVKFEAASVTTGTTATLTVPTASTTLVGTDSVQTLDNKSLTDSTTQIVAGGAPTKRLLLNVQGATASTFTQVNAVQTANRTITLPDSTDTLVGKATTDTLTNKSISGSTNTFTNIPNGATTATTANTPSTIVARDGSGNFSAGTITAALNGNATTATTATTAGSVSGTVAIANGGTGQTAKAAAFTALSPAVTKGDLIVSNGTTNLPLPVGTFGQALTSDSSQALGVVWSSIPQGLKNYITTNAQIEQGTTTGYGLGTVTLTTNFPSGVPSFGSGANANLSISAISSGQLAGVYSLAYNSSAATTAGDFVATDAFTVDLEGQAKVQQFKFYYKAATSGSNGNFSGTSSNSFGVAVYDVTNSAWIQPAGVFNLVQNSGVGLCSGTFQTSSNSTSYRLVIYNANATAGAITMYFDDFFVGPQITAAGAAISDWTSYTPTLGGFGTPTSVNFIYRRVGDSLQIRGRFTAGTLTAATASISLPNGLSTADTTRIPGTTTVGDYTRNINSSYNGGRIITNANQTTLNFGNYVAGGTAIGSGQLSASLGTQFGNNDDITITALDVPIAGYSSNSVMSNDTDTRVVDLAANKNSGSVTLNTTIASWNTEKDSHGAFNATTGVYTVPVSGDYQVSFTFQTASSAGTNKILKNGSVVANGITGSGFSLANTIVSGCVAGDLITVQQDVTNTVSSTTAGTRLSIQRLSGPATIAAASVVAASYFCSTSQSANNTQVNFDTKVFDTHSAVTTGSGWKFTAPISGFYRFSFAAALTANGTSNDAKFYKNGTLYKYIAGWTTLDGTTYKTGSVVVQLNAGDFIDLRGDAAVSFNGDGAGTLSSMCIERIGGII